ncbi:MAG: hypothetical protein A2729_05395 [Candidatus Buchananbacteria bacterium RIFCSPHIGHO2_01_FULL_39_14]|uniref:Glutamyl-tRNA amidotransferase n=2 Tax=Candidatus Buchananiibacteriota TaxID=1817903 RepID=A0A1G1YM25_9BACT|nr:MAG: hypothetical protein A2729_05395 [Candidatus Buchananbacteria bacterium RIFCSPHIGHO2_01_FULL_39_14]OGY48379.1 MAG: hypothetical protein A3D39_01480 [Candidatus Buchananbacteria bacterium RIFCSPHIGHO2_02_FULL_39_17]OGY53413.1 MAG: hypothetical protein A2912_00625 [Candidatus Buchananbacteria bacterium RIFCSPLOWO2_01_FULL_40_23b]
MQILKQLDDDLTQALKQKNELAVLTLRQLKTALTNAEIGKKREALTQDEAIKILRSEVKRRKDAAVLYQKGGRPELAEKEEKEIEIIRQYLPPELGEDEIRKKIKEIIAELRATEISQMGKVVGAVMKELGGSADGSVVSRLAKAELSLDKK